MAASEPDDADSMTWDGYSDYQQVAGHVASEIHDATAAAAVIQRTQAEGGDYNPREIAKAGSRIFSAALLLEPQLELYDHPNDDYQDILEDWQGNDGYFEQFKRADLWNECPAWLIDFVRQINEAGHKLGYLKAGREEDIKDDVGDDADAEVMEVIEEMTL